MVWFGANVPGRTQIHRRLAADAGAHSPTLEGWKAEVTQIIKSEQRRWSKEEPCNQQAEILTAPTKPPLFFVKGKKSFYGNILRVIYLSFSLDPPTVSRADLQLLARSLVSCLLRAGFGFSPRFFLLADVFCAAANAASFSFLAPFFELIALVGSREVATPSVSVRKRHKI